MELDVKSESKLTNKLTIKGSEWIEKVQQELFENPHGQSTNER